VLTMKRPLREKLAIEKRGKRYAIVRVTKVARLVELRVTLSTHASRLDAHERIRVYGDLT